MTERVWRLVAAARRVAATRARLMERLVADTALSPEGVDRAFDIHLELAPSEDEVAALVASVQRAEEVAVILAANVFTAALRAIALAWAAAERVRVRPSRRDPTFAAALVTELADPAVTLAPDLDVAGVTCGEIHVYGRDATIAAVRAAARRGVVVRGHGAGLGAAWIGARSGAPGDAVAALGDHAAALAADVVAFDQRGCLSPRVVLVEGDLTTARRFARALDHALGALEVRVPRGRLTAGERAAVRRWRDTVAYAGEVLASPSHVVAVSGGAPLVPPPPGRHVHVAAAVDGVAARALLTPLAPWIVAFGTSAMQDGRGTDAGELAPAHARTSALGAMQRPRFDGPVDRRAG